MGNKNQNLSCCIKVLIAVGLIVVIAMCFCPCLLKNEIFDALLFFVTALSVNHAYHQYSDYKERDKYDRLSRLNERYATDKNITSVIESILACYNDDDKCFDIEQFCSRRPRESEIHQREMFLRFFEELAYATKTSSLDKKDVCYYFSYYAIVASLMGEKFIEDYNGGCWKKFQGFTEEMREIAKANKYFKMSYEENPPKIKLQG